VARTDKTLIQALADSKARRAHLVDVSKDSEQDTVTLLNRWKKQFKKKQFIENCREVREEGTMSSSNGRQSTPVGVDEKVWNGVNVGLAAMHRRAQLAKHADQNKAIFLKIDRRDQRLFSLGKQTFDENSAKETILILNGSRCVYGRDYQVTDNTLNWVADRPLYTTDAIAFSGRATRTGHPVPVSAKIDRDLMEALVEVEGRLGERITTLENNHESIISGLENVTATLFDETDTYGDVAPTTTQGEEEDMIEPGIKVWHRLTNEGPWIIVQSTVLNIKSTPEGGDENYRKQSFVELAWSVQTEDGVRDFPEVVLTSREPKKKGLSWPKKIGLGLAGVAVTASVVHAPLIVQAVRTLLQ